MKINSEDPEQFWKLLKKLKGDSKFSDTPIDMNTWHSHFKSLHNTPSMSNNDVKFQSHIREQLNNLLDNHNGIDTLDDKISLEELTKTIKSLKTKKSGGPDMIKNEMIKLASPNIVKCLLRLFNAILSTRKIPDGWSLNYIVPIFKGGCPSETGNYRGIAITSCLGKLFSSVLSNRLVKYLDHNKLIAQEQIGFRKQKRTSDHIFVIKSLVEEAKSKRKPIYGCFVDLRKAFDTIWREGLYYKMLQNFHISSKYVNIIQSMYSNVKGQVKSDGKLSDIFNIAIGLRQGCNLSPQLFNMYINDLPGLLRLGKCDPVKLNDSNINMLAYADDMLILSNSEKGLQKALNILQIYCNKWQLIVNEKKTKIIVFNKTVVNSKFIYDGTQLEIVKQHTYLGLKLHQSGSFTAAIKDLVVRAQKALYGAMSMIKDTFADPRLYLKIFDGVVRPILTYCGEIWGCFGIKRKKGFPISLAFLTNLKKKFEIMHLKLCKQALHVPRRASNMATFAELGRGPISISILVAMLKNYLRIIKVEDDHLVKKALHSQMKLKN